MRAFSGSMLYRTVAVSILSWYLVTVAAEGHGAIPLITDDTGTQGKGRFQAEFLAEYIPDKKGCVKSKESKITASLAYGILDTVDVAGSLPYQFMSARGPGFREKKDRFSDLAFEMKWRFFEGDGFSFALKPGLVLPAADEGKGFGTGKVRYCLNLIASKELGPWSFDGNGGYVRNENSPDERRSLWFFSAAFKREIIKALALVGETGIESNCDGSSSVSPVWIGGGLVYSPGDHFDIGLGIRGGITSPAPAISFRGGITVRF